MTTRRQFIIGGVAGAAAITVPFLTACDPVRPLLPPDANGLRLPEGWGFTSRIIARYDETIPGTSLRMRCCLDGAGTFPKPDGGWRLAINHESGSNGGVTMIDFDPNGTVIGARSILAGTRRNCAGGTTPWGTWLSCEEVSDGLVYECDPAGPTNNGVARPALGSFNHEAACVDPVRGHVYLTEDAWPGRVFRFTPDTPGDLSSGLLEARQTGTPTWGPIDGPNVRGFARPEGCWWDTLNDRLLFATTGDNSIWRYRPGAGGYFNKLWNDFDNNLQNVDNIGVSPGGVLYACEDDGQNRVVLVRDDGQAFPVVQATQNLAETAGVCFSPDQRRLYFSTQSNPGILYEVEGPWNAFTTPNSEL